MSGFTKAVSFRSHPRQLAFIFFAELWERFSFYGMKALLALYMVKELNFSDPKAYEIIAAYGALIYTAPIIGGHLADKLLGTQKALLFGAFIIALGHITLTISGPILFYIGLALIVTGTGFFKGNIATLVGQLYKEGDPRRDSGFTLFYMGVNIGAFLAPIVCGYLGTKYGWHYGFGVAAIGMIIGALTFLKFSPSLGYIGKSPEPYKLKEKGPFGLTFETFIYMVSMVFIPVFAMLLTSHNAFAIILNSVGALVVAYILFYAYKAPQNERKSLITILVLMCFNTAFWGLFEQASTSITLFTERVIDRTLFGIEIFTPQLQALNPAFIILLGPLFAGLWIRLGQRHLDPTPPIKFVLALVQVALGFGIMVLGMQFAGSDGKVAVIWLVLAYFLHTTGELCISPIGLSMVTKLAPRQMTSFIMGVWLMSIAFGEFVAGQLAKLAAIDGYGEAAVDSATTLSTYSSAFNFSMYFALGFAALLLILSPFLKSVFLEIRDQEKNFKG